MQSKRPKTKGFTTPAIQKLWKYSFKFDKKSKENYYKEYFQENKSNLIKVWKGMNLKLQFGLKMHTQPLMH